MPALDTTISIVTAPVAVTTVEAAVATLSLSENLTPGRGAPCICRVAIPNVTGLATTASVTLNIRVGTSSAGTLAGSATATNPGAGASAIGPVTAVAVIPAGATSVFVGILTSSGTGTATASATAPIIAELDYLD